MVQQQQLLRCNTVTVTGASKLKLSHRGSYCLLVDNGSRAHRGSFQCC
jgi:hypothetical protein